MTEIERVKAALAEFENKNFVCKTGDTDWWYSARAKAAISAMEGWREMETDPPPKDGTEILAYRSDAGVFMSMYGACDIFSLTDTEIEEIGEDTYWQEDWWAYCQDGVFRIEGNEQPTHWQPLPQPPVKDKDE